MSFSHSILFLNKKRSAATSHVCHALMAEFDYHHTERSFYHASKQDTLSNEETEALQNMHISHESSVILSHESIQKMWWDCIIVLQSSQQSEETALFPGSPAIVPWQIPDVSDSIEKQLRAEKDLLSHLLKQLLDHGFLGAILTQRNDYSTILDSLAEGIIAHDLQRRIFYFSKGAEKLTGYKQSDVIARDCHEIFAPKFCGSECTFCNGGEPDEKKSYTQRKYATIFTTADGIRKEFEVTVVPMQNGSAKPTGMVISINDQTDLLGLQKQMKGKSLFHGIIGQDHKMQQLYDLIQDLAQCDFPVVITGESGTGKELVARAIHQESMRRDRAFIAINCGALPEGTLESELFGHVRGAFTGAIRDKKGRFELADEGTLFLDEIAELSPTIQVKLLRVLQEGTFEPVGSERSRSAAVRIISATNKNLLDSVKKGLFREDLYYRLAVVPIHMHPLRERKNDIPLLVNQFLLEICQKMNRTTVQISHDALSLFMSYNWPGNIRQLQNVIQYALIKCHGNLILPLHLPTEIVDSQPIHVIHQQEDDSEEKKVGRKAKLNEQLVIVSLQRAGGNKAKAARILGVGRATLYNFLRENPHIEKTT